MEKKYIKDELSIHWKPDLCIHSANCVKGLPKVFNPKIKPWINQENATIEELIQTIKTCPSGALSFSIDEDITVNKPEVIKIKINDSGPIIITDGCVIDYQGTQIEKTGTVALCRCGHSENKPFCDGTHRKIGFDTK
jgi:uncharacterized Fe-S cluster protein YjdI